MTFGLIVNLTSNKAFTAFTNFDKLRLLYTYEDAFTMINMHDGGGGGIEIKQASIEDADIILQIQMQAYLGEAEIYNDYSIPPLIQSLNEIRQEFSQQVFLRL